MFSNSHTSELDSIAKFCSDWAWAQPVGSIAPPNQEPCWDKVSLMFMKFSVLIGLIIMDIIHFFII